MLQDLTNTPVVIVKFTYMIMSVRLLSYLILLSVPVL